MAASPSPVLLPAPSRPAQPESQPPAPLDQGSSNERSDEKLEVLKKLPLDTKQTGPKFDAAKNIMCDVINCRLGLLIHSKTGMTLS